MGLSDNRESGNLSMFIAGALVGAGVALGSKGIRLLERLGLEGPLRDYGPRWTQWRAPGRVSDALQLIAPTGSPAGEISTESLILAQDERWRRA